jgi:hypothetical protein
MFSVLVRYPTAAEELRILKQTTGDEKPGLTPVLTGRQNSGVAGGCAACAVCGVHLRVCSGSGPSDLGLANLRHRHLYVSW